jgi:hypothetical protein
VKYFPIDSFVIELAIHSGFARELSSMLFPFPITPACAARSLCLHVIPGSHKKQVGHHGAEILPIIGQLSQLLMVCVHSFSHEGCSAEWSVYGAWVWVWISEAGQAKQTKGKGAHLASPRKKAVHVRAKGWLAFAIKSARRCTTSAARFSAAWDLSSGVILVSLLGCRRKGLLMSKGGQVTNLCQAARS